jgi:hypothetical protein
MTHTTTSSLAIEIDPGGQIDSLGTGDRDTQWLNLLFSRPSDCFVKNVRTKWAKLSLGNADLPVSINEAEYNNAFVCSPYSGCILYSRSEIRLLHNWTLRLALHSLVNAMSLPLRMAKIDRVVSINNWLLTTNLYPQLDLTLISPATKLLIERFPKHAITFRSLNPRTNGLLIDRLLAEGYLLAPSRQVYFFDGRTGDYLHRSNSRRDQQLLKSTSYRLENHDQLTSHDAARIEALYRMLYIDKYSPHNPQVTVEMFKEMHRRRLLTMWGLRDSDGRLDGIVGTFEREGVMTVPLVGYNTALSQRLGLYRLLMAIVLREAASQRWLLNLSSGAASFKRLRGGKPHLEYTAVYCQHLSRPRRMAWHALASLLRRVGGPILEKFEL